MTFWEALGLAAVGVGGLVLFLALMWWSFEVWLGGGDWSERGLNVAAWVLVIAFILWRISRPGGLA